MILVVASRVDPVARKLVRELPEGSTVLLTCLDLSSPGWHVSSNEADSSVCVASGQLLDESEIDGVLTLLPCVFDQELVHIHSRERGYVAAEMTAFLKFWLSGLRCPKLNAPSAGCLSGPGWRPERWVVAAAEAGLPVKPVRRGTRSSGPQGGAHRSRVAVTVMGEYYLGDGRPELRRRARSLASAAGLELLRVEFEEEGDDYLFFAASAFPDLAEAGAADAIWSYFTAKESS
jgi:hypothetical protein